jgi:hypothetical protein
MRDGLRPLPSPRSATVRMTVLSTTAETLGLERRQLVEMAK